MTLVQGVSTATNGLHRAQGGGARGCLVGRFSPLARWHGPKGERADDRRAHWQKVAISACEQCGRNRVPEVHPLTPVADYLQGADRESPGASVTALRLALSKAVEGESRSSLAAGPEAGFDADEEAAFARAGFTPAGLGRGCSYRRPRRLRRSPRSARCGRFLASSSASRVLSLARAISAALRPSQSRLARFTPRPVMNSSTASTSSRFDRVEVVLRVEIAQAHRGEVFPRLQRALCGSGRRGADRRLTQVAACQAEDVPAMEAMLSRCSVGIPAVISLGQACGGAVGLEISAGEHIVHRPDAGHRIVGLGQPGAPSPARAKACGRQAEVVVGRGECERRHGKGARSRLRMSLIETPKGQASIPP